VAYFDILFKRPKAYNYLENTKSNLKGSCTAFHCDHVSDLLLAYSGLKYVYNVSLCVSVSRYPHLNL